MFDISDPRCLLPKVFFGISTKEAVDLALNPERSDVSKEILLAAKKIRAANVHPDTNQIIFPAFRMCGYALFNAPITCGMLIPGQSLLKRIFWQALNQTHNAAINYSNRNASQETSMATVLQGYLGALISSVSIVVGLGETVKRLKFSAKTKNVLSRFIPFPAVSVAAVCNLVLMRKAELKTGIDLYDESGKLYGNSRVAAAEGLWATALTRVALCLPTLLVPPVVMLALEKGVLKRRPHWQIPVQNIVCAVSFLVGLPFAIALFPQEGSIEARKLEKEFQGLKILDKPVTRFYYNKGL
ncbi:sideroflexin-5-like isoform X2 [Zophobas morio]